MELNFNVAAMVAAIPDALIGWLGVFAVTLVIIAVTWMLDTLTMKPKKEEK